VSGIVERAAIERLAGELPEDRALLLERYARFLKESARRFGLVSRRDETRIGEHVVDSAALLSLPGIEEMLLRGTLADLGTGGGLPGLVLAVLRPELKVALVDSRRSRVVFLKQALQELGLENVEIVHERIEHLVPERRFANATARALGRLEDVLEMSLASVESGGRLFLYKGPAWCDERAQAEGMAKRVGALLENEVSVELPGQDRTTTIVAFHVKHHEQRD